MKGSIQRMKYMLRRNPPVPHNRNHHNQVTEDCHEKGMDCKRGRKVGAVFPVPVFKHVEVKGLLDFTEGLSDESSCIWLSSDHESTLLSSDCSQGVQEFDCQAQSLTGHFPMVSLSEICAASLRNGTGVSVFDGSKINPMEEASLVLERMHENINEEDMEEDEIFTWLHNSIENEGKDHSIGCSESGDSSDERSLYEDSSVFESSCASISTPDKMRSCVRDFDKTDSCSLLDLEGEDSELVLDREHGYAVFDSIDFPSPSYKANRKLQVSSSITCFAPYCGSAEANTLSEACDLDDPIFWPFDQSSYQLADFQNFLCISPRRTSEYIAIPGLDKSKPIRWRLHQVSNQSVSRRQVQEECRSRITFESTPDTEKGKLGGSMHNGNSIRTTPSRMRRSAHFFSDHRHCSSSVKERSPSLQVNKQKHQVEEMPSQPSKKLGGSNYQDLVREEAPIEKLVGLNEFDGREGINTEFDDSQFFLAASPRRDVNPVPLLEYERFKGSNNSQSFCLSGFCWK